MTLSSPLDNWRPYPLDQVAGLLAKAAFRWWVSGGIALDLHFKSTWREHSDTDIGVLRQDMSAVCDWLDGWELCIAAGGALSVFSGRPLTAGENNVWARRAGEGPWEVDFTVGVGTDTRWIYRRDPRIFRPWRSAVLFTSDGIPYLAPDLQLLFKSKSPRPKDHDDAGRVIPMLSVPERLFLTVNLPAEHPWRQLLAACE